MKRVRRFLATAFTGVLALWVTAPGTAATSTGTLSVTATVVATCSVATAHVAFGTYGGTQLDGVGAVSITCTNLAPYTVELGAGAGAGASAASRKLTGPAGQSLDYGLYQDAARSAVWGSAGSLQAVTGTGIGSLQSLTVYGRMPASQTPGAGVYTDTVTVTVTY